MFTISQKNAPTGAIAYSERTRFQHRCDKTSYDEVIVNYYCAREGPYDLPSRTFLDEEP